MDQQNRIYMQWNLITCYNMDVVNTMLGGIRQTLKDKYFMIPLALSTQNRQFRKRQKVE